MKMRGSVLLLLFLLLWCDLHVHARKQERSQIDDDDDDDGGDECKEWDLTCDEGKKQDNKKSINYTKSYFKMVMIPDILFK